MATMKLEFNEPLHQSTEDLFIPPTAGKNADSQTLIKKRIAEAVSKKALPSEPKKYRRQWAEETLASLTPQLPVNVQQPETVEKLMAFCQLSVEVKSLNLPEQPQLEGELPSADELPLAPFGVTTNVLNLQQNKKPVVTTQSQKVDNTVEINQVILNNPISSDAAPAKLVTQPTSSLINQGERSYKPLSASHSLLADVGETSKTPLAAENRPLTSSHDVPKNNMKLAHDGSVILTNKQPSQAHDGPVILTNKQPSQAHDGSVTLTNKQPSQAVRKNESLKTDSSNVNFLENTLLNPNVEMTTAKLVPSMQPVKQRDESIPSQPIQHQRLEDNSETPDVLAMQNNNGTQAPTNANAMVNTLSQPRQQTNGVNKMAEVIAKAASVTSDNVAKVEGRSLTYTFNQWQNSPSVTFELTARGSELLATTTSPEVHRALHENQHLFRSEQPLSIRHEEQRHERQRQQQQEQPEQEDN